MKWLKWKFAVCFIPLSFYMLANTGVRQNADTRDADINTNQVAYSNYDSNIDFQESKKSAVRVKRDPVYEKRINSDRDDNDSPTLSEVAENSIFGPYIPGEEDELTIINVTLHVFQDGNSSTGEIYPIKPVTQFQNTEEHRAALKKMITDINEHMANLSSASDYIPWYGTSTLAPSISDSKIRFSLGPKGKERIHFYPHETFNQTGDINNMLDYIKSKNKWAKNELPIILTEATNKPDQALPPNYFNYDMEQYVYLKSQYQNYLVHSGWVKPHVCFHELAHVLDLNHTYQGGGATPIYDEANPKYLADVFGLPYGNGPHYILNDDPMPTSDPWEHPSDKVTNNLMSLVWHFDQGYWLSPMQVGKMHRAVSESSAKKYAIRLLGTNDYDQMPTDAKQQSTKSDLYRVWNIPTVENEWGVHRIYWNNYHWAIEFVKSPEEIIVESLTGSKNSDTVFAVTADNRLIYAVRGEHEGHETELDFVPNAVDVDATSLVIMPNEEGMFYLKTDGTLMHCINESGNWILTEWPTVGGRIVPGSMVSGFSKGVFGIITDQWSVTENTHGKVFWAGPNNGNNSNPVFTLVSNSDNYAPGTLVSLQGSNEVYDDVVCQGSFPQGGGGQWYRFFGDNTLINTFWSNHELDTYSAAVNPIVKNSIIESQNVFAMALTDEGQYVYIDPSSGSNGISYYRSPFAFSINSLVESDSHGFLGTTTDGELFAMSHIDPSDYLEEPTFQWISTWGADIDTTSLTKSIYSGNNAAGLDVEGETFVTWFDGQNLRFGRIDEEIEFIE